MNEINGSASLPGEPTAELLVTSNHHCVLGVGGLLLLPSDQLEGAIDEGEEIDAEVLARHDETVFLALPEVLQIASLVERHQAELVAIVQEQDTYFTGVAQAWLEEFSGEAQALCERGKYWWPEIRNEARHVLIKLMNEGRNAVVSAWYEQTHRNRNFPRDQQEILLTRYFRQLYYERYPVPVEEDSSDEV